MQTHPRNISGIRLPSDSPLSQKDFIYGAATAAFQIEGGRASREPNIWDEFCLQEGKILDNSDGDIACNHFNLWRDDVELMQQMHLDAYRLSIAWPRVLNSDNQIDSRGLKFYHQLLDGLLEKGIKPFVTFYHWDLPLSLHERGGWLNRDTAYQFAEYVDLISRELADKVHSFATLNEPYCSAHLGYEAGIHAPGHKSRAEGIQAAHHLLLGHGLAMQVLKSNAPKSENGIVLNVSPMHSHTDSREDKLATLLADDSVNHWYLMPLLEGRYPELLMSRLTLEERPSVEDGDMSIISSELDFLGLNYYTRTIVTSKSDGLYDVIPPEENPITEMGWEVYPEGLTEILKQLDLRYKLPPVYITENGAAMMDELKDGQVQDDERVDYLNNHLNALHEATQAGVDVRGYFAWSLMDNFEWALGYTKRFGLVYIDYETQKRILKKSGMAYSNFISSRQPHTEAMS